MTPDAPLTGRTMLFRRTWLELAAVPSARAPPAALPWPMESMAAVRFAHCCSSFSYFCLASRRFFSSWPMRTSFRWIVFSFCSLSTFRSLCWVTNLWYSEVSCSIFRSSAGTFRFRGGSACLTALSSGCMPPPASAGVATLAGSASLGLPSTALVETAWICRPCISSRAVRSELVSVRRLSTSCAFSLRSYSTFSRSILASMS
mmetsp:Transcript_29973/g.88970  ORF Transcript_29973/g.88970 Transcript_29973/m.88970 type:complete len:203 (-) Transcript_29973:1422-2030(-)